MCRLYIGLPGGLRHPTELSECHDAPQGHCLFPLSRPSQSNCSVGALFCSRELMRQCSAATSSLLVFCYYLLLLANTILLLQLVGTVDVHSDLKAVHMAVGVGFFHPSTG